MSKKNKHKNQQNNQQPEQMAMQAEELDRKEYVEPEQVKVVVDVMLEEDKAIAVKDWEHVYEPGYYGKQLGVRLELALVEALLLVKRGRVRLFQGEKQLTFQELYDHATRLDRRFAHKYRVYEDLRERGLLVRTGFKFGCDFRVYDRGVQLKKGPKSAKEHTKWIVFSVPEDFTMSFQELSRSVRLAHNIRAKMLWAIVDNEGDCTYYIIQRMKP